ncbi:MAG: AAA family ATPase [Acidimicrobiia bacterium]
MDRTTGATYTVMFTDLVDSTAQRSRLGDVAADELQKRHQAILRDAIEANSGDVVKTTGDGVMAAFLGAADGLACAVELQQSIHDWNESNVERFGVRVGLSLGDAMFEDDDLHGTPVVEAARLCAKAEGGEILCAAVVRMVAGSRATQRFTSVGALTLKGLPEPLETLRVEWEPRLRVEGVGLPFPKGLEPPGRFPFIGRHPELDTLLGLWRAAIDGQRAVALVSGEPGIGKTRLSSELARRAHTQGMTVLYGRCDDELGVPYQPFVEALSFVVDNFDPAVFTEALGRHAGELTRLVPRLSEHVDNIPEPMSADPETSQYRLFEAVAGALALGSAVRPVLFVIDDLHWAAKPTLLMLRHIAMSADPARFLIVGTYRDTDLYRAQPLAEVLADLRRLEHVERITLTGLDAPQVVEFLTRVAGHELDDSGRALAQMIYDETDGNPLFTGEVLRHLWETGAIIEQEGRWTTQVDVTEIGIPDGVREVIGRRLSRLSQHTNDVLQLAAVVGRNFELAVLEHLVDFDRDELLSALDEAVDARVVTEAGVATYMFSHALVRSALYDELRPTRRARVHERVAEALSLVYADALEPHLGELAYHYARSIGTGDVDKAVDYSRRAGDRAIAQLAFDDGVSWFLQAKDLIEDGGGDPGQLAPVLMGLGVAQKYAGLPDFRATLLAAAARAEKDGDPQVLAAAALANTRGFWSTYGDVDRELADVFRTAIAALTPSMEAERAKLLSNLAVEIVFSEELATRRELVDDALAIARELGDDATLAHVLVSRCVALWDMSTLDERLAHGHELAGLTAAIGDPHLEYFASWYRYAALVEAGRIREADAVHSLSTELARNLGRGIPIWSDTFTRAGRALLVGDWDLTEQLAGEQLEIGSSLGHDDALLFYGVLLFGVRLEQGRLAEIADMVREAGTGEGVADGVDGLWGITACVLGDDAEARRILDGLASGGFANLPRHQSRSSVLWSASMMAVHLGDRERAAELYDLFVTCPGKLVFPGLHVFDSIPSTLGMLAATLDRDDDAARHFDEAEALEAKINAPNLLARTRLRRSGVLRLDA